MKYLKEYTIPNAQEARQLQFKRHFKQQHPEWDDSLVLLTKLFDHHTKKKKLNVLDFGCGNGNWVIDELSTKIASSVGVDLDLDATKKNQSVDKVLIGELSELALPADSFDAVISLWVFEHVQNPEKNLKEFHRLLKDGGIVGFVTPNKWYILIILRRLLNRVARSVGTALVSKLYGRAPEDIFPTFYAANDPVQIRALAEKTGFEVLELRVNFDPSYTSFGKYSYSLTALTYYLSLGFFHPHLVVILKKI